jgi:hypothetical protein
MDLTLNSAGTKFTGQWCNGDRNGDWLGERVSEVTAVRGLGCGSGVDGGGSGGSGGTAATFASGLVNMKHGLTNVCYQNALLQVFLTLPSFLPSYFPSYFPSFLPSHLPIFLPFFLPFLLPSCTDISYCNHSYWFDVSY